AKADPLVHPDFAKSAKIQTKAPMGRNPATGEAIKFKPPKKARITPLKGFKDVVLGAAPAPKLAKAAPAKATPAKAAATTRATATRTAPAKAPARRTAATAAKAPARKAPARTTAKR